MRKQPQVSEGALAQRSLLRIPQCSYEHSAQGALDLYIYICVYKFDRNCDEAEVERFYEDLQDLLELTPKKDVLFIIGDWNANLE